MKRGRLEKENFKKVFETWLKRHGNVWEKDENENSHFWWVQNAIGDLFGWEEWYTKFINKMQKKYGK